MVRSSSATIATSRRVVTPAMFRALQGAPAYGLTLATDGSWAVIDTQHPGGWTGTLVLASGEAPYLLDEAGDLSAAARLATSRGRAEARRLGDLYR